MKSFRSSLARVCEHGPMEYQKQGHVISHTRYHVVIVMKDRRRVLNGEIVEYLKIKRQEVNAYYPDLEILKVHTNEDYMHLLVLISPKMAVSQAVKIITAKIGRPLQVKVPFFRQVSCGVPGIWSVGILCRQLGSMNQ